MSGPDLLETVDPRVKLARLGVLGDDDGEGDRPSPVLRPASQDREPAEVHVGLHDLLARRGPDPLGGQGAQGREGLDRARDVPYRSEDPRGRPEVDEPLDPFRHLFYGLRSEGGGDPPGRPEKVRDDGHRSSRDVFEEEGGNPDVIDLLGQKPLDPQDTRLMSGFTWR